MFERFTERARKVVVLACDHGGCRESVRDLCGDVRPGEDRDRPVLHERGQTATRSRIEALRQAQNGASSWKIGRDGAERLARNRDHDEFRRLDDGAVPVATEERDVVSAVAQQPGEHRPPRTGPDDRGLQLRLTKSIATGTPSRSKRSRTWFSTQ